MSPGHHDHGGACPASLHLGIRPGDPRKISPFPYRAHRRPPMPGRPSETNPHEPSGHAGVNQPMARNIRTQRKVMAGIRQLIIGLEGAST